jgi:hypothetical protein
MVTAQGWWLLLAAAPTLLGCGRTSEHDTPDSAAGGASTAGGSSGGSAVTTTEGGAPNVAGGTGGAAAGTTERGGGGAGGCLGPSVGGQPPGEAPWPSLGCGLPVPQVLGAYTSYTVHLTGATLDPNYTAPASDRAYAVWLPVDYDPTRPHRVVFTASGCTSNPIYEYRLMEIGPGDPEPIYVGLAGNAPNGCFDNSGLKSVEWEYFALVADAVERAFCVNKNDELVLGTGGGGTLANMLGCYFSSVDPKRALGPTLSLRGQLSFASRLPMDLPTCGGPIAALWMHDPNEVNPISDSYASLERVLALNGCTNSATQAWGGEPLFGLGCQKYTDCPPTHPVIFCESPNAGRQRNYYSITAPTYVEFAAELSPP